LDGFFAGWIMVSGLRTAEGHTTNGMGLPVLQHRYSLFCGSILWCPSVGTVEAWKPLCRKTKQNNIQVGSVQEVDQL